MQANRAGIIVDAENRVFDCFVREISLSGAKVDIADEIHLSEIILLSFKEDPMKHTCRIVWRYQGQAGVEFLNPIGKAKA